MTLLPGGGGGGGGAVTSVFGRTGAVVGANGDYTGVAEGGQADTLAAGAVTNAMVNAAAAIAYSKLALAGSVVNADINAAAAIAYAKLALTGSVVNADISAAAAIAISKLADPGAGKVIGSSSGAAAVFPPGYELNYTQVTSNTLIADTSESTATALISAGAITFDGGPVLVEFFSPALLPPTGGTVWLTIFEGATQIGRFIQWNGAAAIQPDCGVRATYRFAPTAGSHTYKICGFSPTQTGSPQFFAGAAGTGVAVPAFVRFTKV